MFKEFLIYAKNSKRNLEKTRVFLTMSLLKRKAPHPFVIACQLGFSESKELTFSSHSVLRTKNQRSKIPHFHVKDTLLTRSSGSLVF